MNESDWGKSLIGSSEWMNSDMARYMGTNTSYRPKGVSNTRKQQRKAQRIARRKNRK